MQKQTLYHVTHVTWSEISVLLALCMLITTITIDVLNWFFYQTNSPCSLLLGMKWLFKHASRFVNVWSQIKQISVIFNHLRLWSQKQHTLFLEKAIPEFCSLNSTHTGECLDISMSFWSPVMLKCVILILLCSGSMPVTIKNYILLCKITLDCIIYQKIMFVMESITRHQHR